MTAAARTIRGSRRDPRPQRHEGRVERALGQQSAEEIGDLQDRKERVGEDARAE
jgi:hypothetical protein